ncbi:MAG: translesion error-prone DNA polymerase V autoproteolytic subunit [Planctomycetaceae bacterium]|nr:translesion error-prone DNA polymerase V autoproteolytic subunit [Planctomycetaceae bacterium]MBQ2821713.1 translesion error-prone DNA polymerase V autoproteolytic subunit [Thermoguttaceae bacterium]
MPRGGKRKGAGRPKGTGKFGVPTKAIRVPESMVEQIVNFIHRKGDVYPMYPNKCQAGFPAALEDLPAESLEISSYLVQNPAATFFVRATGESMTGAGIFADDILVVDKSAEPENNDIVIAIINNEFTVKRLVKSGNSIELRSENPDYPSIAIPEGTELLIWGIVKFAIHSV